jgi:hypothetical protein
LAEQLTADDFAPFLDKHFSTAGGPETFMLVKVDRQPQPATSTSDTAEFRIPFILIFRGPPGKVLREGLYVFTVEAGPVFEFYVMPIHTPSRDWQDYQAVFN